MRIAIFAAAIGIFYWIACQFGLGLGSLICGDARAGVGDWFTSSATKDRAAADKLRAGIDATRVISQTTAELERIRTDNQIKLRQAQADIERQQALLVHQGLINPTPPAKAAPPDIVYISIIFCLVWMVAATLLFFIRLAMRPRHPAGHGYSETPRIVMRGGREYKLIPMDGRGAP